MAAYRTEIRIFGLLVFALFSTLILYFGLSEAHVSGEVAGVTILVAGPAGFFLAQVLIFFATGLFRFGLTDDMNEALDRPTEKLTLEQIEANLDRLQLLGNQLERKKRRLEAARTALEGNATEREAFEAGGFRPAGRPRIAADSN